MFPSPKYSTVTVMSSWKTEWAFLLEEQAQRRNGEPRNNVREAFFAKMPAISRNFRYNLGQPLLDPKVGLVG
jgi:hypothetical protein